MKHDRGFKLGRHNSTSRLVHVVLDEAHVKCTSTPFKDANASLSLLKIFQLILAEEENVILECIRLVTQSSCDLLIYAQSLLT